MDKLYWNVLLIFYGEEIEWYVVDFFIMVRGIVYFYMNVMVFNGEFNIDVEEILVFIIERLDDFV